MADWQAAFSWLPGKTEDDETWSMASELAYRGFRDRDLISSTLRSSKVMSANDRYFTNPDLFERFLEDAKRQLWGRVKGRIQGDVKPDRLRPREKIYRIGHSTDPDDINSSSPW
jgi:hypothetical protein